MPIEILMPALSPTMEEGTLSKWLVTEGDTVNSGDLLAEIETDKATMEVEAVEEGVIAKLLVSAGSEGVKVNAPIAILLEDGETDADLNGFETGGSAPQVETAPTSAAEPVATVEIPKATPTPALYSTLSEPSATGGTVTCACYNNRCRYAIIRRRG